MAPSLLSYFSIVSMSWFTFAIVSIIIIMLWPPHLFSASNAPEQQQRCEKVRAWSQPSLACHTPQSQGKSGLVTMCTTSCFGDQILSRPIRLKICNALLSACVLIAGHAFFAVVHDTFVIIAFHSNNSLYARSLDPSFLVIEGCSA